MSKYADVTVQLSGEDGNAFSIIGRVGRALKKAGYNEAAGQFYAAAKATKSYDELLQLVMKWAETK